MFNYTIVYCTILYCINAAYTLLFCINHIVSYYTILYTILRYIILYLIILYYIIGGQGGVARDAAHNVNVVGLSILMLALAS